MDKVQIIPEIEMQQKESEIQLEGVKEAQEGDTSSWLCCKRLLDKGEEEDNVQWGRKRNYRG